MRTKILRLVAGAIITDNKNMSKNAKHQMLEFIQHEATDTQIKGLLLDGKVISNIDKQTEKVLNMRFENSIIGKKLTLQEGTFKSILGMILLSPGGWLLWRTLKAALIEKQRRCGVIGVGAKRDACLQAAQIEISTKTIALLKKESVNCSESKNPKKCQEAVKKEIAKHIIKIQKAKTKLAKFKVIARQGGIEKAADKQTKGF